MTQADHSPALPALRALAAVTALTGATGWLAVHGWQAARAVASAGGRPEDGVVALLALLAAVVVGRLTLVLALAAGPVLAAALTGRPAAPVRRAGGLDRVVIGLVLGAGSLAPQLAAAAPATRAGVAVTADAAAGTTTTTGGTAGADRPVDPTYLGDATPRPAPRPAAAPSPTATPTAPRPHAPTAPTVEHAAGHDAARHVVVRPGDTLWGIADAALGGDADDAAVARAVTALYAANRDAVGDDPDDLEIGTRLLVPTTIGARR